MIDAQVVQETPGVCGGYPHVGNSRIPVRSLVIAQRQSGDFEQIVETFPTLTRAEIRAALDWYVLHPARVDEDIQRNEEALENISRR